MHFSPRMRDVGEPSVHVPHFFRKNIAARKKLKLKKIGLYNLFARSDEAEMSNAVDPMTIEDFTSLNTFGSDEGGARGMESMATHFLDSTWHIPKDMEKDWGTIKALRLDHLHKAHTLDTGLERLYLVNARHGKSGIAVGQSPSTGADSPSGSSGSVPARGSSSSNWQTPTTPAPFSTKTSLRDQYLDQICNRAGPTLKHLIFPARWGLSIQQMARLIRSCPNLTQLSCFFDCTKFDMLRMLVPFLSKLFAIRLITPEQCTDLAEGKCLGNNFENEEHQEKKMRQELVGGDFQNLRYIGLGRCIWEIGGIEQTSEMVPVEAVNANTEKGSPQYREELVWRRKLRRVNIEDVQHVEIWKMDSLDVVDS